MKIFSKPFKISKQKIADLIKFIISRIFVNYLLITTFVKNVKMALLEVRNVVIMHHFVNIMLQVR